MPKKPPKPIPHPPKGVVFRKVKRKAAKKKAMKKAKKA
jgi:hypothetical protein